MKHLVTFLVSDYATVLEGQSLPHLRGMFSGRMKLPLTQVHTRLQYTLWLYGITAVRHLEPAAFFLRAFDAARGSDPAALETLHDEREMHLRDYRAVDPSRHCPNQTVRAEVRDRLLLDTVRAASPVPDWEGIHGETIWHDPTSMFGPIFGNERKERIASLLLCIYSPPFFAREGRI